VLKVETSFGPCWRRYNYDGYGQRPDGGPFEGWGRGRAWPLLAGERGHYELAAGRDPIPFIRALEAFASHGGMLPEQVWDDLDDRGCLGRPTGSAMPLMWAHSEYIKLLRSRADGRVFDSIPSVAARYLAGQGRKDLEIWKPIRQVRSVKAGDVLRVLAAVPFMLHWTADDWQSTADTASAPSGIGAHFVDLQVQKGRRAPVRFTFYWKERDRWEGRDYAVEVI
jgi:glucoamylase